MKIVQKLISLSVNALSHCHYTLPSFMKYSVKVSQITLAFFGSFLPTCDTIEEEKTLREFPFSDLQLLYQFALRIHITNKTRESIVIFT